MSQITQVAPTDRLGLIFAMVLGNALLFAAVFGFTLLTADSVECGSFGPIPYCAGVYETGEVSVNKTVHRNISEYRSTTCYRNGEKINCSEDFLDTNEEYYEEFGGGVNP